MPEKKERGGGIFEEKHFIRHQIQTSISPALSKWNEGIFLEFKLHLAMWGIQSLKHFTGEREKLGESLFFHANILQFF